LVDTYTLIDYCVELNVCSNTRNAKTVHVHELDVENVDIFYNVGDFALLVLFLQSLFIVDLLH